MPKRIPTNKSVRRDVDELFGAVLELKGQSEARRFFRDLLTKKELIELSLRWKVALMLHKKVPYTKIELETGMSSTTIARVHRWLKRGAGGYRLMIKKMEEKR